MNTSKPWKDCVVVTELAGRMGDLKAYLNTPESLKEMEQQKNEQQNKRRKFLYLIDRVCKSCKKRKVRHEKALQLRNAGDEPADEFYKCDACGLRGRLDKVSKIG